MSKRSLLVDLIVSVGLTAFFPVLHFHFTDVMDYLLGHRFSFTYLVITDCSISLINPLYSILQQPSHPRGIAVWLSTPEAAFPFSLCLICLCLIPSTACMACMHVAYLVYALIQSATPQTSMAFWTPGVTQIKFPPKFVHI